MSDTGCSSPVTLGPSATTNYAGTVTAVRGVLHATGIEFSGDFTGPLQAGGAFRISTVPYPAEPNVIDASVTGLVNGQYLVAGTATENYASTCLITYKMTSAHIDQ